MKAAQDDMERALPAAREREGEDAGELVERRSEFTFVLQVPGLRAGDFSVKAGRKSIHVRTPGLEIDRALPCQVAPSTLKSSYVNGVLSLRIEKAG